MNRTSYPLFATRTFQFFQGESQEAHPPGGEARPYPMAWPMHPYTKDQRKWTRGLTWWGRGGIFAVVVQEKITGGEGTFSEGLLGKGSTNGVREELRSASGARDE